MTNKLHPAFRSADILHVLKDQGEVLTLDGMLKELRKRFPDVALPGRSTLGRYLKAQGRTGARGRNLRHPDIRRYLESADPRKTINQWLEEMAGLFPGLSLPTKKAISRYLVKTGQRRKPTGLHFSTEIYDFMDVHAAKVTVDEMLALLKEQFPHEACPGRTAVARYMSKTGRRGKLSWSDRSSEMALFIQQNQGWASIDFLRTLLGRTFPGQSLPSRSSLHRNVQNLRSEH
ncbi:hypothetical protein Gbth_114_004 [Gluconobacter thailandicus F149-1 = NBRC 100600]|uniref:Uncharacterized protein n=1 Tax=Gluconobacter thailandicus NBRC 3257 TaxID=1381097 RepID=A0ABQ0J198_GLUTH|nr:hypothetical protein [Gluconobacter thailandicus]KXV54509.1 hypothetical protein AD946_02615 [Gluconobacter thailandicus]GAC89157.1 hypothetical protein NBRC3255_2818 [Gluconobacter thailandicus NBRC 3255]GAD27573.1 hypothetical protein NBRC3257_2572 [Gluconobacter thailandicus NBRC 3257]GAN94849.1 hypothetical protein Gbth_114_004 [Gluconobacter thailandicus F149-1 = NBRC 100600]GEL88358.1 hypothetical protein GTH01_27160 [Gluconobacter thailandicus F149-1 = NBRC 100600]